MNYNIVEKINRYIEVKSPITCEADALDIIGLCISNDIQLLILRSEAITEEFINLKSGLAGMVLQKFMNYNIKVSAIIEDKNIINDRFAELIYELNKGNNFRVFNNIDDAESWILDTK
ncbi:DUF4180 domain-containing protein [Clostridium perfringens]|uniref:DUF4180 domain-containing protein n=1 Tax=Clostridium perfringens TaxID=1502 RepID=A0AAW9KDL8_CLOPF|nr:DUF4180 domain-containing protein [Clostridium perfringens]MDZ4905247.1 DUF4180 domain-containing protein [Clostridium perfringens]MDZ7541388.1 DUF4180 domain-containing protein [Clostridium perfringens]